jgi:hypothetical protein
LQPGTTLADANVSRHASGPAAFCWSPKAKAWNADGRQIAGAFADATACPKVN